MNTTNIATTVSHKARLALAAALLTACSSTAAQDGTESHTAGFELVNPQLGVVHEETLSFPAFDTMGGTRQLVATETYYTLVSDYSFGWHTNNTSDTVAALALWNLTFTGFALSGDTVFPSVDHPDTSIGIGTGFGVISPAGAEGGTHEVVGAGLTPSIGEDFDYSENEEYLSQFVGQGQFSFLARLDIGDMLIIPHPLTSGVPGPYVFDPEFFDYAQVDRIEFGVQVVYHYATVPAPASLIMLGLGAAPITRRRRR